MKDFKVLVKFLFNKEGAEFEEKFFKELFKDDYKDW